MVLILHINLSCTNSELMIRKSLKYITNLTKLNVYFLDFFLDRRIKISFLQKKKDHFERNVLSDPETRAKNNPTNRWNIFLVPTTSKIDSTILF